MGPCSINDDVDLMWFLFLLLPSQQKQKSNFSTSFSLSKMGANITLWQWVLELLELPDYNHLIQWTNKEGGVFKLLDREGLAQLWGKRKGNPRMTYVNI